jgi:hypothetical protein
MPDKSRLYFQLLGMGQAAKSLSNSVIVAALLAL